jgi:outer membrane protein OmpA-like peptidoglycan-associated protein
MRFLVFLMLLPQLLPAQNLLLNGGFHDINMCKEYYMPCGPKAWFGVPIGVDYFSNGTGYDGKHYIGYYVNNPNKPYRRSFLQTEIMCPLIKDSTYVVEMVVMGNCLEPGNLGIYLPETDYLWETRPYTSLTPAANYSGPSQLLKSNKKNWYRLSLTFKATGKERFLVIGNFNRDSTSENCATDNGVTSQYLDAVSLRQLYSSALSFQQCPEWNERAWVLLDRRERHELLDQYVKRSRDSVKKKPSPIPRTLPAPAPGTVKKIKVDTLVIPDVLFAVDDSKLNVKAEALLTAFAKKLDPKKVDSVVVDGHTDITGTVEHNEALSANRARSVAAYLESRLNVTSSLFLVRGWASRKPVATNKTARGRQANRRVVIMVYRRE